MQTHLQIDTRKIYSVSEVTRDIRSLLEDNFATVWIAGEVSNFKQASSGHLYFTLKDGEAQLTAVMFRGAGRLLKFGLVDGLEIVAHGRISVYEPRGQYQLIVDAAEPKGLGALQAAFEQLKAKLAAEGLFDQKHKKALPYLPQKIGIVTSSKGAALHDMINILNRRFPNIDILVNPVRVQGDGAAEEIATAIDEMNLRSDVDVLIVGRGGGSMEDLWPFNEEVVVRAIFRSQIPIISAVGHEIDFTLSDFVADLRAPTPSAAAELAVPQKSDLADMIDQQYLGLKRLMQKFLEMLHERVGHLRKQFREPKRILQDLKLRLDALIERLFSAEEALIKERGGTLRELSLRLPRTRQYFESRRIYLDGIKKQLLSLAPDALLKRGYSIVFKEGGVSPIRSVHQVARGEALDIQLYEGRLKVKVV